MCQLEKGSNIIMDPCGPLDVNFSRSATGMILITQMFVALLAFLTVEFSTWCLFSTGAMRTFTSLAFLVFWINMVFLVIFLCKVPYKVTSVNWLLITFLQQFLCALFTIVAIIVLAINPCTIGQMIGVFIAVVLLLFYLLGALLVYRNLTHPDRATEPMDPVNANLPEVTNVHKSIKDRINRIASHVTTTPHHSDIQQHVERPYPTSSTIPPHPGSLDADGHIINPSTYYVGPVNGNVDPNERRIEYYAGDKPPTYSSSTNYIPHKTFSGDVKPIVPPPPSSSSTTFSQQPLYANNLTESTVDHSHPPKPTGPYHPPPANTNVVKNDSNPTVFATSLEEQLNRNEKQPSDTSSSGPPPIFLKMNSPPHPPPPSSGDRPPTPPYRTTIQADT